MPRAHRLAILLSLAFGAACASLGVEVDYDPEEDFSAYSTFAWLPGRAPQTGDYRVDNPLIDARIRKAVEDNLTAKGFVKRTDRRPDFYVKYFLAIEKKLDVYTVNRGYVDHWGYRISVPETRVREYEEGTLVIDIADAREKELVWRGVGKGRLREQPTPEQTTRSVDDAVAAILKDFPPGGASRG
ncbi:MAG: DUF4136 domain-containing protein [Myxococcota bacterium]